MVLLCFSSWQVVWFMVKNRKFSPVPQVPTENRKKREKKKEFLLGELKLIEERCLRY